MEVESAWGPVADTPRTRAMVRETRRRDGIMDAAMTARFGWTRWDKDCLGRVHDVGDGTLMTVHEIAAVTGLTLAKVRARIRSGMTGRALIEVDGRTCFDPEAV